MGKPHAGRGLQSNGSTCGASTHGRLPTVGKHIERVVNASVRGKKLLVQTDEVCPQGPASTWLAPGPAGEPKSTYSCGKVLAYVHQVL